MPEEAVDYSIIIPTKNPGNSIDDLIKGLERQDIGSERYEIVVVDSGSDDGSVERFRHDGAKVLSISPASFRHGLARNLGAAKSKAPILIFLSQDAVPADELWLRNLVEPLSSQELAGTYSRQIPPVGTSPAVGAFLSALYPSPDTANGWTVPIGLSPVHFSNVSSALRAAVWKEMNFREDVIMGEDQFWASQAVLRGFEIRYVPESRVIHSNDLQLLERFRRYFDSGISYSELYRELSPDNGMAFKMVSRGATHLARQFRVLIDNQKARWIPTAIFENLIRAIAILLGSKHRMLPQALSRELSWHKHHFYRNYGVERFP